MKTLKKFRFIVHEEANKLLEKKLDSNATSKLLGGRSGISANDRTAYCNPWYSCDAWNCNPDCTCKSNLAYV